MHQEQCGDELWKYLEQITVRPNKAPAQTRNLARLVARPCDPGTPKLAECQHTGQGKLNDGQQYGRKECPQIGCHDGLDRDDVYDLYVRKEAFGTAKRRNVPNADIAYLK